MNQKFTSTVPRLVSEVIINNTPKKKNEKLLVINEKHKNTVFINIIILILFIVFIVFFLLNCKEDGVFKVETENEIEGYYFNA